MFPWQDTSLSPAERARALLSELTLEEKAAQLGSHWHRASDKPADDEVETHDVAPMEHSFKAHQKTWQEAVANGMGHLTRTYGTDPVSVPGGLERLASRQADVTGASRFAIPALAHEECLTGFTALGATVYPAALAWGATWRPELVREMAEAIGRDLAAVGVHQGLSPLLDVVRDYRWGRVEETTGEDPYLVGTLGTAYVQGLQAAGVHATLKHFAGYAASRAGRNHAPISMGRRELEDVIFPPFEMAVREGGAKSVMNSYCDIDGVPATSSRWLLTEVLRERWGFDGPVVSDYWSIDFLTKTHRIAPTSAHAAALALTAGLDVELPATGPYGHLREAIELGILDEATVDTSVLRVLTQKAELGLLDAGWEPLLGTDAERDLDSAHNRDIARRVAEESVILLSNDGVLPLSAPGRVAVVGPVWTDVRSYMGCYAFPNHVLSRDGGTETGLEIIGLEDVLPGALGGDVSFAAGCGFTDGTDEQLAEAVALAAAADITIVTVGDIAGMFGIGTSGEGCDVADLHLPGKQGELLDAVLATGTKVVLVLVTGRPYALGDYAERCAAIIQAFMPGVEGSHVLSRILTGELNPSGRLPIGIPAGHGAQPGTYLAPSLGWFSDGISNLDPRPMFPFGHGISYTRFELNDAAVSSQQVPVDGVVQYCVTVTNTGDRAGAETVQLYLEDPWAEVVRPLKQLIGYAKVDLDAGESRRITFEVHADRTSFTGVDLQRIVEPGEVLLSAGHSSEDRLDGIAVELVGVRRIVDEGRVLTTPFTVV